MSKFNQAVLDDLIGRFDTGLIPDAVDFQAIFSAIKNGIERHEHVTSGGPDSCTGDAAPIPGTGTWLETFFIRYAMGIKYMGG